MSSPGQFLLNTFKMRKLHKGWRDNIGGWTGRLIVKMRRPLRSWAWSWKQNGGSGLGHQGWSFHTPLNMTRVKQEIRQLPRLPSVEC
ncbi:hypothetical protein ILYODFUR_034637 [Ilyodon furcidens]|uniref:Uncharacterized protein n=1 Tax=Ilyodon furcidens TaxID=33524 RepID=A0ABV0V9F7_9TELE